MKTTSTAEDQPLLVCHSPYGGCRAPGTKVTRQRTGKQQCATVLTHFYSMPTPDKKLLQLRKRLCDEDLGECFDGLWQVEIHVERSKRSGSDKERREVLAHCVP